MKFSCQLALSFTVLIAPLLPCAAESPDQLTFTNGDHLHGSYQGMIGDDTISWLHQDATAPINFASKNLHRILFNHGHPNKPIQHNGWVKLNNGDILPGNLDSITDNHVILLTDYAGKLSIPREHISSLSPQAGSGTTIYKGPFLQEEWEIINAPDAPGFQLEDKEVLADNSWEFHSSAWFSTNRKGCLKKKDLTLPEKYSLQFNLYAKSYPGISLVVAADFIQPIPERQQQSNQINSVTENFGTCLLLRVSGTSLTMYHYYFNEDGTPQQQRIPSIANNRQTLQALGSNVDVRVDRSKSTLSVYLDGKFLSLWQFTEDDPILKNDGLGFSSYSNRHPSRVSDILIQHWSGHLDDAVSLNHEELDVVLLHNGTDRFSGNSSKLTDGILSLQGSYADYSIPLNDIKELHFAANRLVTPKEPSAKEIYAKFYGLGKISGIPIASPDNHLHIQNPSLGLIEINTSYLSEIRFDDSLFTLDSWTSDR